MATAPNVWHLLKSISLLDRSGVLGRFAPTLNTLAELHDRVHCWSRLGVYPSGCPTNEAATTYKHWRAVALRCVAYVPENVDAWVVLGYCDYQLGKFDEARSAYRVAAKMKDDSDTWYCLGFVSSGDESIAAYRRSLALGAGALAWEKLGQTYSEQGQQEHAVECLNKAIALEGHSESAAWPYCDLAIVLIKQGDVSGAAQALITSIDLDKGQAFSHLDRSIVDACQGKASVAAILRDEIAMRHGPQAARFTNSIERYRDEAAS